MSTKDDSKRPFTIVVEGNIGSGKSTFLNQFSDLPNVDVLTEPIDKWCNVAGRHNLLQLMYEDPSRHSLTFQSYVQLTMTQLHVKKPSSPLVDLKVMERSLYSARYCFVENLWRSGKLADSEFGVLGEWFKFLTTNPKIDLGVDLIVYLRTTPKIAWERVKARARSEEKVIPLEYLEELHKLHEEWLMTQSSKLPAKVLVVNVDQDIQSCPQLYQEIVRKVMNTIDEPHKHQSPLVIMSPVKRDVIMSPVKHDAIMSPVKRDVIMSPVKRDVIMSPVKRDVMSPVKRDAIPMKEIQVGGEKQIPLVRVSRCSEGEENQSPLSRMSPIKRSLTPSTDATEPSKKSPMKSCLSPSKETTIAREIRAVCHLN